MTISDGGAVAEVWRPGAAQKGGAKPGLAVGNLLVAAREIGDPNFRETVVVLVSYGTKAGAAGFVVNRRTDVPVRRVLPDLLIPRGTQPVAYDGGPVSRKEPRGLWRSPLPLDVANRVLPDTVLLGSPAALDQAIAAGATGDQLRVYLGYAGWSPGQLEREIARGDWHVMPGDSAIVFSPEPEGVWRRQIRLADVIIAWGSDLYFLNIAWNEPDVEKIQI
jgi:putative transcriptional regulator